VLVVLFGIALVQCETLKDEIGGLIRGQVVEIGITG
jgi:hypothetical protein